MRGTSLAVATVVAASALAAGCGQPVSIGSSVPKLQARCVTPRLAASGRTFTITEKDNGKSFCISSGTGVFVILHGTPTRMWAHLRPSSAAVQPRPNGRLMLMRGVTGGYFVATRLGTVTLTSSRSPCRSGGMQCTEQSFFRVRLMIRGH